MKGYKSDHNKAYMPVMFLIGEHGHSNITEDEIFSNKAQQVKQLEKKKKMSLCYDM